MIKIIYVKGGYSVVQLTSDLACSDCLAKWNAGTLAHPKDSGVACTHGPKGWYAVGTVGPRHGFRQIGPRFQGERAALYLAQALVTAELLSGS